MRVYLHMQEQWKPVVGWEGLYSVSDWGRVRRDGGSAGARAGRILKARFGANPYPSVILSNGSQHAFAIHSLVAAAFLGPRPAGMEINHKNGIKTDNRLENLEFVTRSENRLHAYRIGLSHGHGQVGELNPESKLTEAAVRQIKAALARGERQLDVAKRHGVGRTTISEVSRAKRWRHVMPEAA